MRTQYLNIPKTTFDPVLVAQQASESTNRLTVFKKTISEVTEYLHKQFKQRHPIRELIWTRSAFVDELLRITWNLFDWQDDISLVAVGGYGRGELHPHSDIDLLLLLNQDSIEKQHQTISDFVTLLWDMNLDISHSVRTIENCVEDATKDITVVTNLMESRTIIGSDSILDDLMSRVGPDSIWPSQEFFRAKWKEQIDRHQKHGNSEYKLEANIKKSPGGLRDIQMIGWVAKRHFGASRLEDLLKQGFLREEEMDIFNGGLDFVWRVRYALHMIAGREEDRLLFDHQRTLAEMFGYKDDDAKLAVEQFMQVYYRWALALGSLNDVLMQHFDEAILRACDAERIYEINSRFRVRNGHVEVSNDKVFEKNPSALMEIFVLMAQNETIDGVRASTIRLIRDYSELIDEDFRNDPKNRRYFMDVLRSSQKVALQLRRMLRFGVLGKYLPEFGAIIGQMQHDLFHIYSVDAHTMEVVKNMRRFQYPDFQKQFPVASRIVRRLEKPELLYIAGLYHDVGKGRGGNHSTLGAIDAKRFCQEHGLSNRATNLVCWLVENHLLMSSVAQRQDTTDPDVILNFATIVADQTHLDYLYALTVADINATNPNLWNSWRASLLRQLYTETKRALRRGLENPVDKTDWIEENQAAAIEQLEDIGFTEEEVLKIWEGTGDEYFVREKVEDIVWHAQAATQHFDSNEPLILIKESRDIDFEGATQIFIHTKQSESLFALIASSLEQLDLNIHDARIYSSGSGFALDTFFVLDQNDELIGDNKKRITHIQSVIADHIKHPQKYLETMRRRTPRQLRLFSIPTTTTVFTDVAGGYSVLEVITPDRPGLLARIGKIFIDFDIRLHTAKITTLGERVEDVFFITDKNDHPIDDPKVCDAIQKTICKELDKQIAAG